MIESRKSGVERRKSEVERRTSNVGSRESEFEVNEVRSDRNSNGSNTKDLGPGPCSYPTPGPGRKIQSPLSYQNPWIHSPIDLDPKGLSDSISSIRCYTAIRSQAEKERVCVCTMTEHQQPTKPILTRGHPHHIITRGHQTTGNLPFERRLEVDLGSAAEERHTHCLSHDVQVECRRRRLVAWDSCSRY